MKSLVIHFTWNSVKSKLILLVAISYTAFITMLVYNSVQNISLSWKKFSDLNENIMTLHRHNLEMMLATNNEYLISLSPTAYELGENKKEGQAVKTDIMSYIRPRIQLLDEMKNVSGQGTLLDGIFFYFPRTDEFLTSFSSNTTYTQRADVRQELIRCIEQDHWGTNRWDLRKTSKLSFLCRILKIGQGYLGIWVSTDTLLRNLGETESSQIDYIAFLDTDQKILDNREFLQNPKELNLQTGRLSILGNQYVLTQAQILSGDFSLIGLVDEQKVLESFNSLYYSIFFFSLLLLALMVTFLILLHKSILAPLRSLAETIKSIREGNFQSTLQPLNFDQEFREVLETFNAMTGEIQKLKLTVYEEKILQIKTKQQYYQLQIKPHFLTNCLNMIYQFAQVKNYDLIQKMSVYLSTYFRYTLKNESPWITVGEELDHVRNYLKIQKIRYPYHLIATVSSHPQLDLIKIPPLTIQPFVENSIKYAVTMDRVTNLNVSVEQTMQNNIPHLLLRISDDGPGFSQNVLEALKQGKCVEDDCSDPTTRKRIGIYNVQQRFLLFYGDSAQIRFYNNQPHGAIVELIVPFDIGGKEC